MLQIWVWARFGHTAPPNCGAVVTERNRDCEPPAHEWEQLVQEEDQSDTLQSTAHGVMFGQACCIVDTIDAQLAPPPVASLTTVRTLDWKPGPQVAEQALHSDSD